MTRQRAAREPYTTRFETTVTSIDGRTVWLETSYFFGATGDQPPDRGTIDGVEVVDVRLNAGEQAHVLAEEPSFKPGHRVLCSIDWSFRMYCMRAHTAGHVLYGALRRVLEDPSPEYVGLEIGEEAVGIDVATEPLDDETLIELDDLVNRAVWESRPVSWEDVPIARARERDELVFDEERMADAVEKGRVRIVTIGDDDSGNGRAHGTTSQPRDPWDVAACSGTHVRNTREIGPVTVLGQSSVDEGVTRIEFAVGSNAIDRRRDEKRAVLAATQALEVDVADVPDALENRDLS